MSKLMTNQIPTSAIIAKIIEELRRSTKSWRAVSAAFSEADEQYGSSSDAFKEILKATKFSLSKVNKLITISRDSRLNAPCFERVQNWTVLYQVTTLKDQQLETLKASLLDNDVLTTRQVIEAKELEKKTPDPYKIAFAICIDENALKGGLFDGATLGKLRNLIAEIQDGVEHVRVDVMPRCENEVTKQLGNVTREFENIQHEHFQSEIKRWKKNNLKKNGKHPSPTLSLLLGLYADGEEARVSFDANPDQWLKEHAEDRAQEAEMWNEAAQRADEKKEKFIALAKAAHFHANTIITNTHIDQQEFESKEYDDPDYFVELAA